MADLADSRQNNSRSMDQCYMMQALNMALSFFFSLSLDNPLLSIARMKSANYFRTSCESTLVF